MFVEQLPDPVEERKNIFKGNYSVGCCAQLAEVIYLFVGLFYVLVTSVCTHGYFIVRFYKKIRFVS